jgi:hypothetical protein
MNACSFNEDRGAAELMRLADFRPQQPLSAAPCPLSTEARQASKGNFALDPHGLNLDTLTMELAEGVEVIFAKTQPGATRHAVTRLKP